MGYIAVAFDKKRIFDLMIEHDVPAVDSLYIYRMEAGMQNRLAFICCSQNDWYGKDSCEQAAGKIAGYYLSMGVTGVIWGIGQPRVSPLELHLSFFEAAAALQSAVAGDTNTIYTYMPDIGSTSSELPIVELSLLITCIRYGETQAALSAFEKVLEQIRDRSKGSFLMIQMGLFELLNGILKIFQQQDLGIDIKEYIKINNFSSIQEFQEPVSILLQEGCREIALRRQNSDTSKKREILMFIRSHYQEPDFSHDYLSEKLGVSKYKINLILKEDTGYSMNQYITILRHEEAKRRLVETDESIRMIVSKIGYADAANFQRKFKQIEGITPGQYRELNTI